MDKCTFKPHNFVTEVSFKLVPIQYNAEAIPNEWEEMFNNMDNLLHKEESVQSSSEGFEVWTEGYSATGNSSKATFHGRFKGETFRDAVIAFKESVTDEYSRKCIDVDEMTLWGCRFFDNQADASKSFG